MYFFLRTPFIVSRSVNYLLPWISCMDLAFGVNMFLCLLYIAYVFYFILIVIPKWQSIQNHLQVGLQSNVATKIPNIGR